MRDNRDIFWKPNKLLSYNKLFSFVIGNRGGGKSFGAKLLAINNWIKKRKQFVYVRRYGTELETIQNYFSDVIKEGYFADHSFDVSNGCFYIDDEVAGYFIQLSTSSKNKSTSYPDVSLIIFDEFIIDKGTYRYLKDEVTVFMDLYETIARPGSKEFDVRVLFISNAISAINPYFVYFNIIPRPGQKFINRGQCCVEMYRNEDFVRIKKGTKFGQLIEGTKYAAYNIDNEFLRDNDNFIQKMTGDSICWYVLIYMNVKYSVWYNTPSGFVYVTKIKASETIQQYAITTEDYMPNMLILNRTNKVFKKLKEAYEYGQVRFDCLQSKSAFMEYIGYL